MDTVRITSTYWLDRVRRRGKDFRLEIGTSISGCGMVFRGPLGLAGPPETERTEEFRMFSVNGGELRCWIHRDVLRGFASQGPFSDGSYLFAAGESGKLRLFFEKGFPLKEESRKEE